MARLHRTTLALLVCALGACNTASENEGCVDPNDPSKPGPDTSQCVRSTFPAQNFRAREVSGIVRRGEDPVVGAGVRIRPSALISSEGGPLDTNTDVAGFYRVPGAVASLYDISFKLPNGQNGRDDILLYRGVAGRYLEPQLDVPVRGFARSWIGKVDVRFDVPVPAGHAVLFLANGTGVAGVTGDSEKGLEVYTASYTSTATLHAIEYEVAAGLVSASAYAKADVVCDAGTVKVVTLHLDPIPEKRATPKFELDAPPGFVPGPVEVRINVGRSNDAPLVSIPWGSEVSLPPIPNVGFNYLLRATRADGAVSDSGESGFDIYGTTKIKLVAPPDVVGPASGATFGAGELLLAGGPGVIEHVFEPELATGASLHIVLRNGPDTPLADARAIGVSTLTGAYTWTVRSYSTLPFVENVVGVDARRFRPVGISAPRQVILR